MLDGREDQAAGLRRLFRRAPPQVVALYAGGRRAADNAALAASNPQGQAYGQFTAVDVATWDRETQKYSMDPEVATLIQQARSSLGEA